MIEIREYSPTDEKFLAIQNRGETMDAEIRDRAQAILDRIRSGGDAALLEAVAAYDKVTLTPGTLRIPDAMLQEARNNVDNDFLTAVTLARVNIRRFHEYQRRSGYVHDDGDGVRLSKRVLPLKRIGIYCPAGQAPLFSTMLMCAVPAQIAGVSSIAVAVPPRPDGTVDPHILAVAGMLDIDDVYVMGGAHAVGALAYGTETVGRVDKIVGPGGPYVTMAKRLVFGTCGIESLAGPSEIVVVADATARARYLAADMMSQLEHGSGYEAGVLFTDSRDLAVGVKIEIEKQAAALPRRDAIARALDRFGGIFLCKNLSDAIAASNALAPEHLELVAENQEELLSEVENAGAVFLGHYSSEPVGDYFAGTNHVLPTAGAARFSSSLSVYDFVKDISVISYSAQRLARTGRHIIKMAETEGLGAHANAIRVRLEDM